jgi:V-type H+-transporting ATPase subunit a
LNKIRRIAQSLGCTLYPLPKSPQERRASLQELHSRIEDLSAVLHTTSQTRRTELERIAESLNAWWGLVRRERLVYDTMNRWKWGEGRRTLLAEGWVPTRDIGRVQAALRSASVSRSYAFFECAAIG